MLTFDPQKLPISRTGFTAYERPLSGKQFHRMSEYAHDCEFTAEELAWFTKFKDGDK